jgi:hypothetical protein
MAGSNMTDILVLGAAAIGLVYAMKTGMLDQIMGAAPATTTSTSTSSDDDDSSPPPPVTGGGASNTIPDFQSYLQSNPAAMQAFQQLPPEEQAQVQQMYTQQQQLAIMPAGSGSTPTPVPLGPGYPPGYGPYGGPYPGGGIPPQQARQPVPPGYVPQPVHPGQSYPYTGYPTSSMTPAGNPAPPGLLSSLIKQNIPPMPSYITSPVGTYSPYSPYNQFYQYHQYSTNPTIYRDTRPDDNLTFLDIDKSKYYVDNVLGSGNTTSCVHCYNTCKNNPGGYGCANCRPKCKVETIRTLSAGGMGWNIGPANVVGSFFTDILKSLTGEGLHDSEHYDRDREFDCHNKRIRKPSRRRKEMEDHQNEFVDPDDYQFDRNDVQIALQ